MDLHDYSHTVNIDELVSVTFFAADPEHARALDAPLRSPTGHDWPASKSFAR